MGIKIGLLGLAGAGKDTFALMLQDELNKADARQWIIDRYAKPLKDLTCAVFGKGHKYIEDRELKEKPIQFRREEAIEHVFHCLSDVLKFDDVELDEASHLYFENFQGSRAMSPREFQQLFGTEVVRKVKSNAWRDRLQNRVGALIVPDVRFENELCDFNILIKRHTPLTRPEHSSEHLAYDLHTDLELCSLVQFVVFNTTTLEELRKQAKAFAEHFIKLGV